MHDLRPKRLITLAPVAALTLAAPLFAGAIHLRWDPVPDVIGYRVYYGTQSGSYNRSVVVGQQSSAVLRDLVDCTTWYVAVKAFNGAGESPGFSNEIVGWPRPEIRALEPAVTEQGARFTVDVLGANFRAGASLGFGEPGPPQDAYGNPLVRIENTSVPSCGRVQALLSVEPTARGVRAMEVGTFPLAWRVRNPDATYGRTVLDLEVGLELHRWDINRSDVATTDRIDGADLSWLSYSYGSSDGDPFFNPDSDLNGDGIVDGVDLAYLASGFGSCWTGTAWSVDACG